MAVSPRPTRKRGTAEVSELFLGAAKAMIGHKNKFLKIYQTRFAVWAGQVRQSLGRELHALQVSHQDAAFMATVKGDAYQHLLVRDPVTLRVSNRRTFDERGAFVTLRPEQYSGLGMATNT